MPTAIPTPEDLARQIPALHGLFVAAMAATTEAGQQILSLTQAGRLDEAEACEVLQPLSRAVEEGLAFSQGLVEWMNRFGEAWKAEQARWQTVADRDRETRRWPDLPALHAAMAHPG